MSAALEHVADIAPPPDRERGDFLTLIAEQDEPIVREMDWQAVAMACIFRVPPDVRRQVEAEQRARMARRAQATNGESA